MSTKIDELPPYVGTTNPIGDIPISINGVTYRITPQLLMQTLQEVLDNNHDLVNGNNFQGSDAGFGNTGVDVNAFGVVAGYGNTGNSVNAFGNQSGFDNTGSHVNAFGYNAALSNTGSHVNAFGKDAGNGNQLSGQTIFSNTSLPSYANYAAAATDITTANGATAGCSYLFYNVDKQQLNAIRL